MEKDDIKNLFTFSKSERRGAFALAIAIVILLLYNIFSPYLFQQKYDFSAFYDEMAKKENKKAIFDDIGTIDNNISKEKKQDKNLSQLYNFDPNTTTEEEWINMGLSPKQAASICKYINKGGHFYNKEDLKKMYSLNAKDCNRLMPFVIIEDLYQQHDIPSDFGNDIIIDTVKIELNSANIKALMQINGIGPATARGILKYKNYLGGYVNKQQLLEVYQIDSSRFYQIVGYFTLSLDSVRTYNLNSITYFDLKKHPYISKSLAYEIIQYRSMKGDFKSVADLKNIKTISDSLYQKIYLYFAVSEK